MKEDGRANPVDVTMSLAKGARMRGVRFFENTPVADVITKNGRATVRTPGRTAEKRKKSRSLFFSPHAAFSHTPLLLLIFFPSIE